MDSSTPEQRRIIVDRITHRDPSLGSLRWPRSVTADLIQFVVIEQTNETID